MPDNKQQAINAVKAGEFNTVYSLLGNSKTLADNTDPDIAYIVGISYFHQRNDTEAEAMLIQCLVLQPTRLTAAEKLIHLYGIIV